MTRTRGTDMMMKSLVGTIGNPTKDDSRRSRNWRPDQPFPQVSRKNDCYWCSLYLGGEIVESGSSFNQLGGGGALVAFALADKITWSIDELTYPRNIELNLSPIKEHRKKQ